MTPTAQPCLHLPADLGSGLEIDRDDEGTINVSVLGLHTSVPVEFKVRSQPRRGRTLDDVTSASVTTYRVTLSDAAVIHAELRQDGPLGGESWEHVIAYRTGLFGYVLYQWIFDVPAADGFIVAAGVCLAEDAAVFEPLFRAIVEHVRIDDETSESDP